MFFFFIDFACVIFSLSRFWNLFCWFLCVLKLIIVKMMMIGVFVSGLVRTMSLVGQWAGNSPDRSHTYKDDVDTDLFSPWWEHTQGAKIMMKILKQPINSLMWQRWQWWQWYPKTNLVGCVEGRAEVILKVVVNLRMCGLADWSLI